MSNSMIIMPPLKFSTSLESLDTIFKSVEKFDIIHHTETLSASSTSTFNLISSICNYIKAKNKTDAMEERFARVEENIRKNLRNYKIEIDAIESTEENKITNLLEIFKLNIKKTIIFIKNEYRKYRDKFIEKVKKNKLLESLKTACLEQYKYLQNIMKSVIENFKDICSNFKDYTFLCDQYYEYNNKILTFYKMEV